jgi:predicted naringenin-chalcone synthase
MPAAITGLGTAVPEQLLPTEFYVEHAKGTSCQTDKQARILENLYRKTGIATRATALNSTGNIRNTFFLASDDEEYLGPTTAQRMRHYELKSAPLAGSACRQALEAAKINSKEVTHLITVSCTGFYAPGFDIGLINNLSLPTNVKRTHVGFMGCHGALNGLRIACSYVEADPKAVVLLCAVELCSLHFQYGWNADALVANSLFSDGAAALVVRSTSTENSSVNYLDSNSLVIPGTESAMGWNIEDHGFVMHMSVELPYILTQFLPGFLDNWLARLGHAKHDISEWIVHPGGPRILDAVIECLGLANETLNHSRNVLNRYGNMSSPTILFVLNELLQSEKEGFCLMLGFGPGLTIEGALLNLKHATERASVV